MRYHSHHHFHIAEHKIFFVAWLLLFVLVIGWFLLGNKHSDEELIRLQGRAALQDISARNSEGLCEKLAPQLVERVRSMQLQELEDLPSQLPKQVFCAQAASAIFGLYGDYYVASSSINQMGMARVVVQGSQATLYFTDGEYQNTSRWIKQNDQWAISDGILGLIKNVARPVRTAGQPKSATDSYTP